VYVKRADFVVLYPRVAVCIIAPLF
jgi:hypothetical protein